MSSVCFAQACVLSSQILPVHLICFCQGEELESLSIEQPDDPPSSTAMDDDSVPGDSAAKLSEVESTSAADPTSTSAVDVTMLMSTSTHPAEGPSTAEDSSIPSTQPAAETEVDFSRLDIDAEQLVASLFGDDDSSVSFEQPPTDNKKGFVSPDHEDAAKWFYQDPQGVIQGKIVWMYFLAWRKVRVSYFRPSGLGCSR